MTVVLLGIIVIAVLSAVRASVRASTTAETAAEVETLVVNAIDQVTREPITTCDYTDAVTAAVERYTDSTWDPIAAHVIVEQAYLEPDGSWTNDPTPGDNMPVPCAQQVWRVTVTISAPDGGLSRTIQVVKSEI